MVRTQIRIPDETYEKAKQIAADREISLAELARRGLEYMLSVYARETSASDWQPPKPRRLGWKGPNEEQLKAAAQTTSADTAPSTTRRV